MSIIDSSVKPKNVTLNNGASISTTKSRFGGGSLSLSGRSDHGWTFGGPYAYIQSNTDFGFGTGDFTIEMWIYPLDLMNWRTLISVGSYTNGILWRIGTGGDQLYFNGNYWNWNASSVPLNVWSHIALVRNNGVIKTYINGTETLSISGGAAASDLGSSKEVHIGTGGHGPGSEIFNGYIDEIRITKGIGAARYTSNFDVKTLLAPFPSSGTAITPPEVISNLSVLARDQRADLSWTPPAEDNGGIITDYSLQYSTDNVAWSGYDHAASAAPSGMISGLTNGTTYSVRVAPINVAGTGSYVSQSNVTPILPPVLSITQEPLNNRVISYDESATFSISAELTNNTNNSSFSYQWQKYDFDFYNTYDFKWNNISNSNSSSININTNAFESYYYGNVFTGSIRCILTSPYETKISKTVRIVDAGQRYFSFDGINADYNGYIALNNNYYNGYIGVANQRYTLYLMSNTYYGNTPINDDSWYNGNDTKIKYQYSLDGSVWNNIDDTYSLNFRNNDNRYYISTQTPPIDLSGRVYFRIISQDLWPYSTNNGTSSTTESTYSRVIVYYFMDYSPSTPGTPSNVVADPGDGLAIVSWNAPTITGGATITYTVQYSLNGGSWTTFGTSTSTSLMVTGLSNGSGNNYTFRVSASNSAGTGSYSAASSSINTDASYASTPGVPTNITGIAGNTKVLLNWVAPSNIGKSVLTDYVVQLSTDDGATWENYVEPASSPTPTPTPTNTPTPTATPTPTPTPPPVFYSPSASWSSISFSGDGTLNNKYLGSRSDGGGLNSISIRVTSAGKLHMTADFISADGALIITRNSNVLSLGDSNGYFTNSFNFETMAVANGQNNNVNAGDLITISDPSDYLTFTNLRIWWTPL